MSTPVLRRFTVDEYHRMAEAGIFSEDDRVELIEGEIIQMVAISSRHAACVDRLNGLLSRLVGDRAIVRVQNPIRLDRYSEPQPDVALLRPRADHYAAAHPGPRDVLLVVEVAATSEESDRAIKVPLYARSGVREVWLVDLDAEVVEVNTDPGEGGYRTVGVRTRGQHLSPGSLPDLIFGVDAILG